MSRISSLSSPFLLGFDEIERVLDRVAKAADGYPPYNIERIARDAHNPERLRITLALAGFTRDQLDVTLEESQLVIRGRQQDDKSRQYLHRGIAARQFQRSFVLAEGMEVLSADLKNGLLSHRSRAPAAGARRQIDRHHGVGVSKPNRTPPRYWSRSQGSMPSEASRTAMTQIEISPEALAHLGDGEIAYVKTIRSEDVHTLFPQVPDIQPGLKLFALHAADGTPIMLTDSREAAIANAVSQQLETVSVH